MVDLMKQIDFSQEIAKDPELEKFILNAAAEIGATADFESIKKPQLDLQFKVDVVIGGLPAIPPDMAHMLLKALKNYLIKHELEDPVNGQLEINLGTCAGGKVGVSAYVKFPTPELAETCVAKLDGAKFDAKHVLDCFFLQKIRDIYDTPDVYVEKEVPRQDYLQSYNVDKEFRDQLLYRELNLVRLQWFDFMEKTVKDVVPHQTMEKVKKVEFSLKGTYLIAQFDNGFKIYGGADLKEINFFLHTGVKDVRFSPNEKYCFSFNGTLYAPVQENFIMWQVLEGKKLRSFKAEQSQSIDSFKFSADSNYIAGVFIDKQYVSVFELPSMQIIKDPIKNVKSTIPLTNIRKIEWHTTRNILICLAYPQMRDKPASQSSTKITLIDIPTRNEIKWKVWAHDAGNGKIHVSTNGDWVGVVMGKLSKKKITSTCIQIGSFKKRDLEIDTLDIAEKVIDTAFDVDNNRFAVVYKDESVKQTVQDRFTTLFYSIEEEKDKTQVLRQIGKIENTMTRKVLLANNGIFFVLCNIDKESPSKGNFTFGYFNKDTAKNKVTVEIIGSHFQAYMSYCQFDPSCRFVVLGSQESRSIQVWTVYGEQLFKDSMPVGRGIADVCWRPRSKLFLDAKGEKAIVDDWKNIKKKYEQADDRINNSIKYEQEQRRKRHQAQFLAYLQQKRRQFSEQLPTFEKIRGIKESTARTAQLVVQQRFIPLDKDTGRKA